MEASTGSGTNDEASSTNTTSFTRARISATSSSAIRISREHVVLYNLQAQAKETAAIVATHATTVGNQALEWKTELSYRLEQWYRRLQPCNSDTEEFEMAHLPLQQQQQQAPLPTATRATFSNGRLLRQEVDEDNASSESATTRSTNNNDAEPTSRRRRRRRLICHVGFHHLFFPVRRDVDNGSTTDHEGSNRNNDPTGIFHRHSNNPPIGHDENSVEHNDDVDDDDDDWEQIAFEQCTLLSPLPPPIPPPPLFNAAVAAAAAAAAAALPPPIPPPPPPIAMATPIIDAAATSNTTILVDPDAIVLVEADWALCY